MTNGKPSHQATTRTSKKRRRGTIQINKESQKESEVEILEDKIISKVVVSTEKETKVISLRQRMLKIVPAAIAASFALLISISYFNKTNTEINFDNLAHSEIETWFLENSSSLTSEDIATFIPMENININDFAYTNIDDEVIEDYIIYNENTTLLNEIN